MKAKKSESWRTLVPKRLKATQHAVEKRVREGWAQAIDLLPPAPRKTVKRLTADVDRLRHDLRKRGDKTLADVRKRAEHLTADVEKRIKGVVAPLTTRMDVASRTDVERLRKRIEHLERRIEHPRASVTA